MNLAQSPPIVLALLIIYLLIKDALIPLIKKRNGKLHTVQNNPHPCAENGQRIASLEKGQDEIENRLKRIENKLDGIARPGR